jgi:hypothetical protein
VVTAAANAADSVGEGLDSDGAEVSDDSVDDEDDVDDVDEADEIGQLEIATSVGTSP